MRSGSAVHLAVAALVLVACTDQVDGVASPGPAGSSTAPPSGGSTAPPPVPSPRDEQLPDDPSFPTDTTPDSGPAQPGADEDPAGSQHVQGLRFDSDEGSTRLVVDLSGSGVPEWTVGYSPPTGPGGDRVDIQGEAFLRVQVRTGAQPGGRSTSRISLSPGPVAEALTTGLVEGTEEILLGVRGGELPFRAFALTDPGRIVIDVRSG